MHSVTGWMETDCRVTHIILWWLYNLNAGVRDSGCQNVRTRLFQYGFGLCMDESKRGGMYEFRTLAVILVSDLKKKFLLFYARTCLQQLSGGWTFITGSGRDDGRSAGGAWGVCACVLLLSVWCVCVCVCVVCVCVCVCVRAVGVGGCVINIYVENPQHLALSIAFVLHFHFGFLL